MGHRGRQRYGSTILVALVLGGCALAQGAPPRAQPPPSPPEAEAASEAAADEVISAPETSTRGGQAAGGDPILLAAGDIGDCDTSTDAATGQLVAQLPGAVAVLGDIAYEDGSAEQFASCYNPTWGAVKDRTRPAPGNHEYRTSGAAGYFDYFGQAAGTRGEGWYSYNLGPRWHAIVLNSNCSEVSCAPGSAQHTWLQADLAANTDRNVVAYWHHPRFSTGRHGDDENVTPLWQALYDAGAEVVLNGHDHDYERFAPLTPQGQPDAERGLRQFVVGTGGTGLRSFETSPLPTTEVRDATTHGVLRLTLHDSSYDWEFIPAAGDFTDAGSSPVH